MSFRNMVIGAGIAGIIALGAVFAQAQEVARLRAFDANGDKAISIDEAKSAFRAEFTRMDADRNGALSPNEFVNAKLATLSRLDTDHDGRITRSEIRAAARARMGR